MLRRLCTLMLMLACAFAPVVPAQAGAAKTPDCCHSGCACNDDAACMPPPAAPSRVAPTSAALVEHRVAAAKPAARPLLAAWVRPLALSGSNAASAVRRPSAKAIAAAADVALFKAHCSLRL